MISPEDMLEDQGRVWFRNLLSEEELAAFDRTSDIRSQAGERLGPSEQLSEALAQKTTLRNAIQKIDAHAHPVRLVAFNKSETANWGVPWHQDRVIAVSDRHDVPDFKNWTRKTGIWHCEPPAALLDQMLFVRLHLDDASEENGAMEIAVGSHREGVIPASQAEATACRYRREVCSAKRGDVLVLKMLTLHASRPARRPSERRTLRIDFSSSPLPKPLEWYAGS